MDLAVAFGTVLKKYRVNAGYTQDTLAEVCGIERTFISMLERGERKPSLSMTFKLAEAFDVLPSRVVKDVEVLVNTSGDVS